MHCSICTLDTIVVPDQEEPMKVWAVFGIYWQESSTLLQIFSTFEKALAYVEDIEEYDDYVIEEWAVDQGA